jgi:hypothetical protein
MRKTYTVVGGLLLVALSVQGAQAAALGIQLDTFLATFETFVIGMGMIVGLVGLMGWIGASMDNSFGHILAGSIGFFTRAGLLGGGTVIMGLLGLTSGAVVPL